MAKATICCGGGAVSVVEKDNKLWAIITSVNGKGKILLF
jgi:hypothetical protein